MSRGDEERPVPPGTHRRPHGVPIEHHRPPFPHRHPLGVHLPAQPALGHPHRGAVEQHPEVRGDPDPSWMQDAISIYQVHVGRKPLCLRLLDHSQIGGELPPGEVGGDVGEPDRDFCGHEVQGLSIRPGKHHRRHRHVPSVGDVEPGHPLHRGKGRKDGLPGEFFLLGPEGGQRAIGLEIPEEVAGQGGNLSSHHPHPFFGKKVRLLLPGAEGEPAHIA